MGKQDPPRGARPLDQTYERIQRDAKANGKDAQQAKRDAAEAVHEERRQEAAPDEHDAADTDRVPR